MTDEIRDLLVSFDISKAVDVTQPFAGHIASLLNPLLGTITADVVFQFKQPGIPEDLRVFKLHRFYWHLEVLILRKNLMGNGKI